MKIPKGMTEEEVLEIMGRIANRLAYKYRFGYHDIDDMKQQAYLEAIKGMDKYEEGRPLENFLWVHVKNRLFNFKRDNFQRPDKPCYKCPLNAYDRVNDACLAYDTKLECVPYYKYEARNLIKKNIMQPVEFTELRAESEKQAASQDNILTDIMIKELISIIDKNLINIELRKLWLQIREGVSVPKDKRIKVFNAIEEILKEYKVYV